MSLDLPPGSRAFVDSNILIYHFTQHPLFSALCTPFLRRVVAGEITGFTSALVIADALHKVMLADVQSRFVQTKPLAFIQRHPALIASLATYHAACHDIGGMKLHVIPVEAPDFRQISGAAIAHNLLTNDASIIALMRRESLEHLVTNDDDFDDISGITPWKPR